MTNLNIKNIVLAIALVGGIIMLLFALSWPEQAGNFIRPLWIMVAPIVLGLGMGLLFLSVPIFFLFFMLLSGRKAVIPQNQAHSEVDDYDFYEEKSWSERYGELEEAQMLEDEGFGGTEMYR